MSRLLFPAINPYQFDWLATADGHQLYFEQSGNPDGIPVIYIHGGPGAGSNKDHRRYFDPQKYRIILFDQRGCGLSKPALSLHHNTTAHLLEDIEAIRCLLAIDKWMITGGSWGTTLALAYGIKHPQRVSAFILRGIFLGTRGEYDWLYRPSGVERFFPEYYQEFVAPLPASALTNPLAGYQALLHSENELAVISASKAWYLWELRLSSIEHHQVGLAQVDDTHIALCMAKLSCHYFSEQCFLPANYLLENIKPIQDIPAIILHGRYDMVCQIYFAHLLANRWKNAQLQILPGAGHSGFESQTIDAFCKSTDTMANFLTHPDQ